MTDKLPKDTIREKITTQWNVEDVNRLEQEGRIMLRRFAEWHLIDNRFDPKRSKAMMVEMARKALDNGRKGLRFVHDGNSFYSSGRKRQQIVWELSLEKQFNLPITVLCTYSQENIRELTSCTFEALVKSHNRMVMIGD